MNNRDPEELAKFEAVADDWWNPKGSFKPLHELNPIRLEFILQHSDLQGKKIIDVGCGGGILTESLVKKGAQATGIDLGSGAIHAAKKHAEEQNLFIDYQVISAEEMAAQHPAKFDAVTCMELLEHVPDPIAIIEACANLVKPGGNVYFSTLNRHLKAYALAIVGAEHLLKILPKGTHDYEKFIKPSELATWARMANLSVKELKGIAYQPFFKQIRLTNKLNVNYMMYCQRNE